MATQLISDEEEEEEQPQIIVDSDTEEKRHKVPQVQCKDKLFSKILYRQQEDILNAKENWWELLHEEVPKGEQCHIKDCTFAPFGHRSHPLVERNYSFYETKLIIQYLIYYDCICNGKGLQVWEEMHARGYMTHRPIQSLNNNFKRYLLRDIRRYNLPKDLEDRFLELRS